MGCAEHIGRSPLVNAWKLQLIRQNALAFLNASPLNLHHAYLLPSTVFITTAMEWRLGGFELLTGKDDSGGVLWGLGGLAPGDVGERSAPEVREGGWTVLRECVYFSNSTYSRLTAQRRPLTVRHLPPRPPPFLAIQPRLPSPQPRRPAHTFLSRLDPPRPLPTLETDAEPKSPHSTIHHRLHRRSHLGGLLE